MEEGKVSTVVTYGPEETIAYAHYFLPSRFALSKRVLREVLNNISSRSSPYTPTPFTPDSHHVITLLPTTTFPTTLSHNPYKQPPPTPTNPLLPLSILPPQVKTLLPRFRPRSVLDFGCGPATVGAAIAEVWGKEGESSGHVSCLLSYPP